MLQFAAHRRNEIARCLSILALIAAAVLVSCGGDNEDGNVEDYPSFTMTYELQQGVEGAPLTTWELDYRNADDWTKTLIAIEGPRPVGRTAVWDGDRIAWASSPDGQFVEDQAPEPDPVTAFPEVWFVPGYRLDVLPTDLLQEIEPLKPGTLRFRSESLLPDDHGQPHDDARAIVQTLTLDEATGIPLEYEHNGPMAMEISFRALDFTVH